MKNYLNFAWLEENISVPVSWEGKTKEHSMCVGDCIDSERDRFSAKGVLKSVYRYGRLRYRYGQLRYRCGHLQYRYGQLRFIWQERASRTVQCTASCLQRWCTLLYCTLLYCSQDSSPCTTTVQPLGPPSVNYLRHSADLPVSSV